MSKYSVLSFVSTIIVSTLLVVFAVLNIITANTANMEIMLFNAVFMLVSALVIIITSINVLDIHSEIEYLENENERYTEEILMLSKQQEIVEEEIRESLMEYE